MGSSRLRQSRQRSWIFGNDFTRRRISRNERDNYGQEGNSGPLSRDSEVQRRLAYERRNPSQDRVLRGLRIMQLEYHVALLVRTPLVPLDSDEVGESLPVPRMRDALACPDL